MAEEFDYSSMEPGSDEMIAQLTEEHMGWATSIAKSVARAWNMDWQLDGLDGGAYEGLLFCARRFDPARGVPFRGYARRRIHEACTEEARQSKAWQRGTGSQTEEEKEARELSAKLFDVFPELRMGKLPETEGDSPQITLRSSVRQLLAGASLLQAFKESGSENPELSVEYKELVQFLAELEPVHQEIIWAIYYRGQSMRSLAEEWGIDDLSVIREHKELLQHLSDNLESSPGKPMKVRRGLRTVAQELRRAKKLGPFADFLSSAAVILITFCIMLISGEIL